MKRMGLFRLNSLFSGLTPFLPCVQESVYKTSFDDMITYNVRGERQNSVGFWR